MKEDYIVVEHAVKKYKDTIALNDVSLTFAQNQIHGIIGRNGSGKTVLLKCICGLTRLTSGRIILDGKVVGKDMEIPDNIGAIIETPGFIKSFSGKYSLGMRQRLGIAQAIMEKPDILILDEPTNGLDKKGVEEFRNLILAFKQEGKTIILASHNAEDVRLLCDNVSELDGGRLIEV